MVARNLGQQRLQQQCLAANPLPTPEAVVAWLGAVQAQEYAGAKWALGQRMQHATDDLIEQAFTTGSILRTHVLRPTWHFVTPADIRWMLELTAPRVKALLAYNDRRLDIDAQLIGQATTVLEQALEGGQHLTKAELGAALGAAGMVATGLRLGQLIMHAELSGVICSGPRRGKQFTYALLHERAPNARQLPRDEALTELARRYFTGHGPATIQDFVWWSGLSVADAKAGVALAADLINEERDGQTYYYAASLMRSTIEPTGAAFLLPTFDEFLVGYAGFDRARRGTGGPQAQLVYESTIVMDGDVIGSWRRTFKQGQVIIDIALFDPCTATQAALPSAAQRYGAFVGMPLHDAHAATATAHATTAQA